MLLLLPPPRAEKYEYLLDDDEPKKVGLDGIDEEGVVVVAKDDAEKVL